MNRNLLLIALVVATALIGHNLSAGTDAAPTGSNIRWVSTTHPQPVQESLAPYKGGACTGYVFDTTVASPQKLSTIMGGNLTGGTNKIRVRCAWELAYGGSTITRVRTDNCLIATSTEAVFRGTTAELQNIYFTPSTGATNATPTIYIFQYQE